MPYVPTVWEDEIPADTPILYKITETVDGDITPGATIEIVTSVTPGTPVNAANLNKMEGGIETAQETAEQALASLQVLIKKRQGGSATQWDTAGPTNYTPGPTKIQAGAQQVVVSSAFFGDIAITFPETFAHNPLIFVSMESSGSFADITISYNSVTPTGFAIRLERTVSSSFTNDVFWMAIGD